MMTEAAWRTFRSYLREIAEEAGVPHGKYCELEMKVTIQKDEVIVASVIGRATVKPKGLAGSFNSKEAAGSRFRG